MYSYSFPLIQGAIMDLPQWYFNLSVGILVLVAILTYGTD